jgi:hypothetical protein
MGHSHGKKRLRYQWFNGHKFAYKRKGIIARSQRSMCGLTMEEAQNIRGSGDFNLCDNCRIAAEQTWA